MDSCSDGKPIQSGRAMTCAGHPSLLTVASCADCRQPICGLCAQRHERCAKCFALWIAGEAEGAQTRLIFLPVFALLGSAFVWFTSNLIEVFAALLSPWAQFVFAAHGAVLMPLIAVWSMGCVYGGIYLRRSGLERALWLPQPLNALVFGGLLIGGFCLPFGVAADWHVLQLARSLRATPMRNGTRLALPTTANRQRD